MFQVVRNNVTISDDSDQTKDVQVFIAIRKAFAKDDIAFLRYHLFTQYFGPLKKDTLDTIATSFKNGYNEIHKQLSYPRKERIFAYVKNITAVFLILEDLFRINQANIRTLFTNEKELEQAVLTACQARYHGISSKVHRAIFRSFIFILLTKAFFAFTVEGTVENLFFGRVIWSAIFINISVPPILMVVAGFFIKPPGQDNSKRILSYVKTVLFQENARIGSPLLIKKIPDRGNPAMNVVFSILWLLAFILSFGILIFFLSKIHFNIISQAVFIFFLTIVSFLTYRIGLMSKVYSVEERQRITAPLVDFFFMPAVRVGRQLTEGISQINIFLFIFDFIIETPFKGISGFLEQWFFFLRAKREEME